MDACTYNPAISAYHDGELPEDRRSQVEAHITECPRCAAELAELQRLSGLVREQQPQVRVNGLRRKLHARIDDLTDRSVLRFAEVLAGVAAVLLVTASLGLQRTARPDAGPVPPWEQVAVSLEPQLSGTPVSLRTAQWIVSDLAPEARE